MLISQPISPTMETNKQGLCGDAFSSDDESPPASYRRRRFFKSGLSTYEEVYSRNATGRRLGRCSLHVKLNTGQPTITLLLSSNCGPRDDDPEETPLLPSPSSSLLRQRSVSESEMDDPSSDNLKLRSNSFDYMLPRASSCPDVMRPKAIVTDKFSFFRHRSSFPRGENAPSIPPPSSTSDTPTTMLLNSDSSSSSTLELAGVRPSFPVDDDTSASTPADAIDSIPAISTDSPSTLLLRESNLAALPRDSSISAATSYQSVAIHNSVNVVRFVSGYKNAKLATTAFHPRGTSRGSLDVRPSLDSVRKSALHKKNAHAPPEAGLTKKLRDARNRIPLEFRDELRHLLDKPPHVPKPKTTAKSVHFSVADLIHMRIFEWEADGSDDDDRVVASPPDPSTLSS
ncbi:hypothetical protein DYB35_000583 [Aphanomyces astaci]|uniref:Uncharacterized protein n=2 Tax=Aphanomyces astaci TaxID=112090 RepID=A0A3R6ZL69_APHAT|nr:hypothetical protein DYB35_000583 [Aphanomyces astaci]